MRSTMGRSLHVFPVVAALVLVLTGCMTPAPSSPIGPESSAPSTPSPTPAPTFDPNASADDAMVLFDSVNTATLATDSDADGRAFIEGLTAAGLDKGTMELTADQTTIGHAADSIQFSVRWGESCLIGQNGPAVGGYHSTLAPVLGTGKCLIGSTRPIDW
jgi:hypothetical protein